jgi:predicted HTH domain antitoxin
LNEGIVTLLEAAKYEHKEIDVMKHLLATASFAKKFSDPS